MGINLDCHVLKNDSRKLTSTNFNLQFFIGWIDSEDTQQISEIFCSHETRVVDVKLRECVLTLKNVILLQNPLIVAHPLDLGQH